MFYKSLGFVVWKGAVWYLRRRYGPVAAKRFGAGGVALVAAGGAAALLAQRRGAKAH